MLEQQVLTTDQAYMGGGKIEMLDYFSGTVFWAKFNGSIHLDAKKIVHPLQPIWLRTQLNFETV